MKSLIFFLILFFSLKAFGLKESYLGPIYTELSEKRFHTTGFFKAHNKTPLAYIKFGHTMGEKGSLVFINGKAENILKYIELFYDLYHLGFSPIYAYDHRGQGFSVIKTAKLPSEAGPKSEAPNITKTANQPTPIENYDTYQKDLKAFIAFTLQDPKINRQKVFAIAHSMGGAILLNYLQSYLSKPVFKAILLSAPMIKIQTKMPLFFEDLSLGLLRGFCGLLSCRWSIPSIRKRWSQKTLTNSLARYKFSEYIVKNFLEGKMAGVSFRWVVESFKLSQKLLQKNLIPNLKAPVMILQSTNDFFVSNNHQNQFCKQIPNCRIVTIEGKHEIFLEKDPARNKAINHIARFFSQHN